MEDAKRLVAVVVAWEAGSDGGCRGGSLGRPWRMSSSTRTAFIAMAAADPFTCCGDDLRARVGQGGRQPRAPGTLVTPPVGSVRTQPFSSRSAPSVNQQSRCRDEARRDEHGASRGMTRPVVHLDTTQPVVLDEDRAHGPSTMPMARATSSVALGLGEHPLRCEDDDVVAPLPHDLGVADRVGCHRDDAERLVADLVAVAVGAVQHVAGPAFTQASDVGKLITQTGGEKYLPGGDLVAAANMTRNPAIGGRRVMPWTVPVTTRAP